MKTTPKITKPASWGRGAFGGPRVTKAGPRGDQFRQLLAGVWMGGGVARGDSTTTSLWASWPRRS